MKPFFEQNSLRFSCTRCGRCCMTGAGYYVYLDRVEADRLRDYLQLSHDWFRRRYLEKLESGELVASAASDGRCVFLDRNGQCKVYPVRPLQCRTYPFWPELVSSQADWDREARRCEGMNRGEAVPVSRIRKAVRACLEADQ